MMLNERWVVALMSPDEFGRIPEEQVVAGTQVDTEDGSKLLIYRDRFTALKAAFYAGSRALRGCVVKDDGQQRTGAVKLGNGELLLLAPGASVDRPGVFPQDVGLHSGSRQRTRASRRYAPVAGSSLQRPSTA